jgi:hypothetical protein
LLGINLYLGNRVRSLAWEAFAGILLELAIYINFTVALCQVTYYAASRVVPQMMIYIILNILILIVKIATIVLNIQNITIVKIVTNTILRYVYLDRFEYLNYQIFRSTMIRIASIYLYAVLFRWLIAIE